MKTQTTILDLYLHWISQYGCLNEAGVHNAICPKISGAGPNTFFSINNMIFDLISTQTVFLSTHSTLWVVYTFPFNTGVIGLIL